MLKELAITPDVFDPEAIGGSEKYQSELRELLAQVSTIGMIANLDRDNWRRTVGKLIALFPDDTTRTSFMRLLSTLYDRKRLPAYPRRKLGPPEVESHWIDLIREASKGHDFDWVAVGPLSIAKRVSKSIPVVQIDAVRQSELWTDERSFRVRQCESDITPLLSKLVRHAKRIELVDPYLSPDSESTRTLIELLTGLAGQSDPGSQNVQITINTTLENSRTSSASASLESWRKFVIRLRREKAVGHRFKVAIWKDHLGDADLHDRFILTEQCGVSVPGGLAVHQESTRRKTIWTLLEYPIANELRTDFNPDLNEKLILAKTEIF